MVLKQKSGSTAPCCLSTRHRQQKEQCETQSEREWKVVAKPRGNPSLLSAGGSIVISAIDNKNKKQAKPIVQLACYKKKRISPTGQTGLALQRLPIGDAEGAIACSVAKRKAFSNGRVPVISTIDNKNKKQAEEQSSTCCLWWTQR